MSLFLQALLVELRLHRFRGGLEAVEAPVERLRWRRRLPGVVVLHVPMQD